jgi:exopolysaccharide biosynthesis polyprenyl glycosylphosphotransferase
MEPEILASPGESSAGRPDWPNSVDPPAGETSTVEATSQTGTVQLPRLQAPAKTDAWPRPTNGHANGNGSAAANGHANGHAHGPLHASRTRAGHGSWTTASRGGALPTIVPFETPRADGTYLRAGKRALDVLGAALALVATAPVLGLIALLIKLESRGPVLYRSTRIGRGGRPFTFFKLRSMVKDAESHRGRLSHLNEADGPVFKLARDPRVTRVGRFLRTTSLDEIPQFWNVLIGDMSLVGPRPPIPEEVAQYEPWQLRRLDVRPGITCLWQISGRSRIGFQEWMRLDLEYIRRQSLALDMKILLHTIPAVLSREGAY